MPALNILSQCAPELSLPSTITTTTTQNDTPPPWTRRTFSASSLVRLKVASARQLNPFSWIPVVVVVAVSRTFHRDLLALKRICRDRPLEEADKKLAAAGLVKNRILTGCFWSHLLHLFLYYFLHSFLCACIRCNFELQLALIHC